MQLNFSAPKPVVRLLKSTKPDGRSLSSHILVCVEIGLDEQFPSRDERDAKKKLKRKST